MKPDAAAFAMLSHRASKRLLNSSGNAPSPAATAVAVAAIVTSSSPTPALMRVDLSRTHRASTGPAALLVLAPTAARACVVATDLDDLALHDLVPGGLGVIELPAAVVALELGA